MWLLIHASNQRAHCTVTWQLRASLIQSAHSYTLSAWLSNQGSCINHGMHISNRCIVPIMDSESSWASFPFHRGLQWPYRSTRSPDIARMVHASAVVIARAASVCNMYIRRINRIAGCCAASDGTHGTPHTFQGTPQHPPTIIVSYNPLTCETIPVW